jgi:iron-sulfur cluster insertion protein
MSELIIDETAKKRIQNLRKSRGDQNLMLRLTVEGGGCSGFQYKLDLTTQKNADDQVFEGFVICDSVSIPLLVGATVRFEENLVAAEFKIDNPNAVAGCGCGMSFAV